MYSCAGVCASSPYKGLSRGLGGGDLQKVWGCVNLDLPTSRSLRGVVALWVIKTCYTRKCLRKGSEGRALIWLY